MEHRLATPTATRFPYTTLFRSVARHLAIGDGDRRIAHPVRRPVGDRVAVAARRGELAGHGGDGPEDAPLGARSEEHTSELQSHVNLVCRLLLDKITDDPVIMRL